MRYYFSLLLLTGFLFLGGPVEAQLTLLGAGGSGSGATGIALVAHTTTAGVSSGPTTSPGINTTSATLFVASVAVVTGSSPVVSDSKGNTWTALTGQFPSGGSGNQLFYVANPTVGSGHTFTISGSNILGSVQVMAFRGVRTVTPFDVQNGFSDPGTPSTIQPGSVTPSLAGSVVITGLSTYNAAGFPTINGSYIISDQVEASGVTNYSASVAYLIQTAAVATNPTWTLGVNAPAGTAIAVFGP